MSPQVQPQVLERNWRARAKSIDSNKDIHQLPLDELPMNKELKK